MQSSMPPAGGTTKDEDGNVSQGLAVWPLALLPLSSACHSCGSRNPDKGDRGLPLPASAGTGFAGVTQEKRPEASMVYFQSNDNRHVLSPTHGLRGGALWGHEQALDPQAKDTRIMSRRRVFPVCPAGMFVRGHTMSMVGYPPRWMAFS